MPFIHLVSHKDNTVFARIVGDIPTDEVISTLRKLGQSPKVPDNLDMLFDLRQSRRVRSHVDAKRIVKAFESALPKCSHKIIFLASDIAFYGASRMTATLAELSGYDAHAARTEEEACALLGIKSMPSDEQFAQEGFEL